MLKKPTVVNDDSRHLVRNESVSQELELVARFMDSFFRIPGSRIRFGFDALLGLIPGFGDLVSSIVSLYFLSAARQQGVPRVTLLRMVSNMAIDFSLGSVPIVGDIFDVYWKANERNVSLLRQHLAASPAESRRLTVGDWVFVSILFASLVALLVGAAVIAYYLLASIVHALFPPAPQVV